MKAKPTMKKRSARAVSGTRMRLDPKSIVPWSALSEVPDIEAKDSMPAKWAAHVSSPRVVVSGLSDSKPPRLERLPELEDAWTLTLPPSARFEGLPVRYHRIARKRSRSRSRPSGSTKACRPPWVSQQLIPRASISVGPRYMRTLDGELVVPVFEGIFGPDDRREYLPSGFPWQCVGVVRTMVLGVPGVQRGSGVLIGPRHVLTASHMIPWTQAASISFTPAEYNGQSVLGLGAQSFATDAIAWRSVDNVSAYDMAVLRLANPLGDMFGFWGTMAYQDSLNDRAVWQRLGYPAIFKRGGIWQPNQPVRPFAQAHIAVLETDSDGGAMELKHHGDATKGDSGGPLMGFSIQISAPPSKAINYLPVVIGVTSGQTSRTLGDFFEWDEWNVAAGGQALVDLVALAHAQLP